MFSLTTFVLAVQSEMNTHVLRAFFKRGSQFGWRITAFVGGLECVLAQRTRVCVRVCMCVCVRVGMNAVHACVIKLVRLLYACHAANIITVIELNRELSY